MDSGEDRRHHVRHRLLLKAPHLSEPRESHFVKPRTSEANRGSEATASTAEAKCGFDKLFWVVVRRWWSGWKHALIVVTPEPVVPLAPVWFLKTFRAKANLPQNLPRQGKRFRLP